MKSKIRHVGIMTKDLRKSEKFYGWFGFKVVLRSKEVWKGETLDIVKMGNEHGDMVELIKGNWKPHVAFTVKDSDAMERIWKELNEKAETLVEYKKVGDVEVVYLKDPDGNYVEIVKDGNKDHR